MNRLVQINRFPIKSIGREPLQKTTLVKDQVITGDRDWAVILEPALDQLSPDGRLETWLPKSRFMRGSAAPKLQAISGGGVSGTITLSHPDLSDISIDPHCDSDRLIAWLAPLWPDTKPPAAKLVQSAEPLTDSHDQFVSILSIESLRDLEHEIGLRLGTERWRGNLWVQNWTPWVELDMIGQTITIGEAVLKICEPIGRCSATSVDPETGEVDGNMLNALMEYKNHTNFGVYAQVIETGDIALGDEVTAT